MPRPHTGGSTPRPHLGGEVRQDLTRGVVRQDLRGGGWYAKHPIGGCLKIRRKISIRDNCQNGSRIKMRFHGAGRIISENWSSAVATLADIGNIIAVGQRWPQRIPANTKASTMIKRQSTTAKVTRATAALIRRYILATGSGVIVRHRGVEYGVESVKPYVDVYGKKTSLFVCHDQVTLVSRKTGKTWIESKVIDVRDCTILKSTITSLQTWASRTDGLRHFVLVTATDGTVGNAAGRYVVSEPNGLVFDDEPLKCLDLAVFADDTLGAETVGVWRDSGKVYVDSNRSFDRLSDALEFGRSSGQLAIYDTVDSVCIDC